MIKVLHILSALDGGGVEMMLQNYCTRIDRNVVSFDFAVHGSDEGAIEKKMKELGYSVFHVTPKKVLLMQNMKDIDRIIRGGGYDIVHVHQNSISFAALYLAKKHGVKVRIVHAHGLGAKKRPLKRRIIFKIFRLLNFMTATDFWACGEVAGSWLYGKRWHTMKNKHVMHNAVEAEKFIFNEDLRIKKREELGLSDKHVLIYVARMERGKNQEFLLPVMKRLPDKYHLLLVGNGKTEDFVKSKISEEGLENKITVLGRRTDIPELLCASDFFLFPSMHEGLGIVAIEAQANGLRTIASTGVPEDTHITDIIDYIELDVDKWVKAITEADLSGGFSRKDMYDKIREAGYSVNDEAPKYQEKILQLTER